MTTRAAQFLTRHLGEEGAKQAVELSVDIGMVGVSAAFEGDWDPASITAEMVGVLPLGSVLGTLAPTLLDPANAETIWNTINAVKALRKKQEDALNAIDGAVQRPSFPAAGDGNAYVGTLFDNELRSADPFLMDVTAKRFYFLSAEATSLPLTGKRLEIIDSSGRHTGSYDDWWVSLHGEFQFPQGLPADGPVFASLESALSSFGSGTGSGGSSSGGSGGGDAGGGAGSGGTTSTATDASGSQTWSSLSHTYNAHFQLVSGEISWDDGSHSSVRYDASTTEPWRWIEERFDSEGGFDFESSELDIGGSEHWDIDQAGTEAWLEVCELFSESGDLTAQFVTWDDGLRTAYLVDASDLAAWYAIHAVYSGDGALQTLMVRWDNGGITVLGKDAGETDSWHSFVRQSSANGDLLFEWTRLDDGGSVVLGGASGDHLFGIAEASLLRGELGDDTIDGARNADTLNGGEGADSLSGGAGNDLFMVDQLGDLLADRSGADSVIAAVDFSLGAGFEFLKLEHTAVRGTGNGSANLLIGNAAANLLAGGGGNDSLRGENGNDTLTGGVGADTMAGGTGADRYIVDRAGDVLIEAPGEGADMVIASVSWVLAADFESLQLIGAASLTGTGNELGNRLSGNDGNNLLHGLGANDKLIGGAGADTLVGGTGRDVLNGGTGADWFLFEAPNQGPDVVVDFVSGLDRLAMMAADFGTGLVPGALAAEHFVAHASSLASSAAGTSQFIYNTAAGLLLFDPDGAGGTAAARLAVFTGAPTMSVADFAIL